MQTICILLFISIIAGKYLVNPIMKFLKGIVNIWMKVVENNINLGFGLSLIVVAEK